ncbi:MAG: class I SAM-dependent methyltransferase [Desulfobacterales bacterium]
MACTGPFEKYLDEYEDWFEKHRYVYLSEIEAVRHFIPQRSKGIEIGIGTGRFALPFGITEGVEPAKAMREFSSKLGLKVHPGVAEKLPLADGSFDFVLMVTTICFVDDILQSFREANRILNTNDRFIIGMVDRNSPLGKQYEKIKKQNKFYRIATFYSVDEVVVSLNKTGFGNIEMVQTVFGDPELIDEIQAFQSGQGQGGFVVIKANKRF